MPAAPGEVGASLGRAACGRNDRARATLPSRPRSQRSKPFFISWRLFLKALWHFLLKPKGSHAGSGRLPGRDQSRCLQEKAAASSPAHAVTLAALLTLGKLSPATGIGAHPKIKKLGLVPRRVLRLSPSPSRED